MLKTATVPLTLSLVFAAHAASASGCGNSRRRLKAARVRPTADGSGLDRLQAEGPRTEPLAATGCNLVQAPGLLGSGPVQLATAGPLPSTLNPPRCTCTPNVDR